MLYFLKFSQVYKVYCSIFHSICLEKSFTFSCSLGTVARSRTSNNMSANISATRRHLFLITACHSFHPSEFSPFCWSPVHAVAWVARQRSLRSQEQPIFNPLHGPWGPQHFTLQPELWPPPWPSHYVALSWTPAAHTHLQKEKDNRRKWESWCESRLGQRNLSLPTQASVAAEGCRHICWD